MSVDAKTSLAEDPGLYVTELIADAGSRAFEKRVGENVGYAFAGVTNVSPKQSYTANVSVTDPRGTDLASASPERYIQLPQITVPPRESLILPLRLPLKQLVGGAGSLLEESDEIYYATAELGHAAYDANTLSFDFTAPMDGEVALRFSHRPLNASVDGQSAQIREDRGLFLVSIPKGGPPNFQRKLSIDYPLAAPSLHFTNDRTWLRGEKNSAIVRIDNPGATVLQGELQLSTRAFQTSQSISVEVQPHANTQIIFRVDVPTDRPEGMIGDVTATLRSGDHEIASAMSNISVHALLTATVEGLPGVMFPLREDQSIPIVHPCSPVPIFPVQLSSRCGLKIGAGKPRKSLSRAQEMIWKSVRSDRRWRYLGTPRRSSSLRRLLSKAPGSIISPQEWMP